MATNLLDQLAESQVPPPPEKFDEGLHDRLNEALTTSHLVTFVLRSVPYVLGHLLPAVGFLVQFTFTGEFNQRPERAAPDDDSNSDTSDDHHDD